MSEESNPILGYADSYRSMERQGTKSVNIWSVITDLERNMAPLMTSVQSELAAVRRRESLLKEKLADCEKSEAALREELAKANKDRETLLKLHVHLRARRSYWIAEETKARRELTAAEQRNSQASSILNELRYDPRLWLMVSSDTALKIGEFLKAKPTESGASE